tara:strand:+ start:11760 stop:12356 length:597 start_codon:yes stop_codon:yes gene_type:complete
MKQNEIISLLSTEEWRKVRHNYHVPNKGMDREAASLALLEVDDIFRELGIKYFLSCGTALGFYRDGDFISWDDEIDIEIFSEVYVPRFEEIKETFISHGFITRATFRGKTSKMAFFKHGIKIATSALYDNGMGYRCDLQQKFPNKYYNNGEKFNFRGRDFILPGPAEEYLTFYYGDWKTPIKSYNPNEYLNKNNNWRK